MEPSTSDTDPTAVFGRRVQAALIDAVATLFLWWLISSAAGGGAGGFFVATLAAFVISFVNVVVVQGETGASFGKWIAKVRTVDRLGRKPRARRAILRWQHLPKDLLSYAEMKDHPQHRRGGDLKAGTFVIDAAAFGELVPLTVAERQERGDVEGEGQAETVLNGESEIPEEAAALAYADDPEDAPAPASVATFPLQLRGAGTAKGMDPVNGIAPTVAEGNGTSGSTDWDPARAAYVHRDASTGALHQFDPTTGQWFPLTD